MVNFCYAYKLPEQTSIFEWIEPLREVILPVRYRLDAELLYLTAVSQLDDAPRDQLRKRPLAYAVAETLANQNTAPEGMRDQNSVKVLFFENPEDRSHYVTFSQRYPYDAVVDEFAAENGWQDFKYHRYRNRPDDVSEQEWEHRRDVWERILSEDAAQNALGVVLRPSQNGALPVNHSFAIDCPEEKQALAETPAFSRDHRLTRLIRRAGRTMNAPPAVSVELRVAVHQFIERHPELVERMVEVSPADTTYDQTAPSHNFDPDELLNLYRQAVDERLRSGQVPDELRPLMVGTW